VNTDTNPDDLHWMRQAVALSETALYNTAPNPRVACLIVRGGQLLASGVTQAVGGPHAEVMALRQAQERGCSVAGATVYVTLEPCSHYGRTPPCVDALIAAKPARVVIALADPNPLVGGQGIARLRAAGIGVATGVCGQEALQVNPGFIARMTRRTPWVWLKLAASLDGRSALRNGQSQWITGPAARADGHHWRARSCVVLTGAGTVRMDNPQLSVRHVRTDRQPIKAIVDTRFEVNEDAGLFDGTPAWVFTCQPNAAKAARLAQRNVQVIEMPAVERRVDLAAVMHWLAEHDINEVHVETGAKLSGALLQAGCVDELLVYMAPVLLGDAFGMVQLPLLESLDEAQRFEFMESKFLDADIRLRARHVGRWKALLHAAGVGGDAAD
jgi:diaminohydroxyphosphoribosylaminopyrimidine deaminase/5-amino-6-(5-phosphoribosylamino)uracil reductase